jgi:hypothetical protein
LCCSCDKEDEIKCIDDCAEEYLVQNGMVRYQGEDVGCKFFLNLYEYQNKQYFLFGNHCADMISYPTDCDRNKLCETGVDTNCKDFYKNAKFIGIVGIKK